MPNICISSTNVHALHNDVPLYETNNFISIFQIRRRGIHQFQRCVSRGAWSYTKAFRFLILFLPFSQHSNEKRGRYLYFSHPRHQQTGATKEPKQRDLENGPQTRLNLSTQAFSPQLESQELPGRRWIEAFYSNLKSKIQSKHDGTHL